MIRASSSSTALLCLGFMSGCGGSDVPDPDDVVAVRGTTPTGALSLHYPRLPDSVGVTLSEDLRLGSLDGHPSLAFGDIRSIEAASDGTIFVLDYQASDIRTFDATGTYLGTIATEGDGPGELSNANGMILIADTLLWVQDHGKRMMLGLARDGTELHRIPMHVGNHGYMWNGTVDDRDRFWKPTDVSERPDVYPPPEGLNESVSVAYLVSYDIHTESVDSVLLGPRTYRSLVKHVGTGSMHLQIPFDVSPVTVVDPTGGFWHSDGSGYQIVRLDESGDTTLVISADVPPLPVTIEDQRKYVAQMTERDETMRSVAEEVVQVMRETQPAIAGLSLDDSGNVWVRRGATADPVRFDVFSPEGDFLAAVGMALPVSEYLPPRFRSGSVYVLTHDELDVPYVVRAAVPVEALR